MKYVIAVMLLVGLSGCATMENASYEQQDAFQRSMQLFHNANNNARMNSIQYRPYIYYK